MISRTICWLVVGLALALGGPGHAWAGLTLEQALNRALAAHPARQAAAAEVAAREGAALQAGLRPNPEMSLEVEAIGAPGGGDALETTFSLGQALELGGKRKRRERAAILEADLARQDQAVAGQDLRAEVQTAFFETLAAQERLAQAEALGDLATRGFQAVEERVAAGKVSPIEKLQARVAVSLAQIELRRARVWWETGKSHLAALWGGTASEIDGVVGELAAVAPLRSHAELAERLALSPDWARGEAQLAQRRAALEVAQSLAAPDLTLSGGVRSVGSADEVTGLVGISLPLPLFDRNQGAIQEAQAEIDRVRAEVRAERVRLRTALATAYQETAAARAEALALAEGLLPDAEAAFEAVREGYRLGKFDLQRLLDAQHTVAVVRTQLLDAQEAYLLARTRLERLTGTPASDSPAPTRGASHP